MAKMSDDNSYDATKSVSVGGIGGKKKSVTFEGPGKKRSEDTF